MTSPAIEDDTLNAVGGSLADALCGLTAVVLAIAGLFDLLPVTLTAIGLAVVCAALFLESRSTGVALAPIARRTLSD